MRFSTRPKRIHSGWKVKPLPYSMGVPLSMASSIWGMDLTTYSRSSPISRTIFSRGSSPGRTGSAISRTARRSVPSSGRAFSIAAISFGPEAAAFLRSISSIAPASWLASIAATTWRQAPVSRKVPHWQRLAPSGVKDTSYRASSVT